MLLFVLYQTLLAQIIETNHFSAIKKIFKQSNKESLVIFDVKGVLIKSKDQVFSDGKLKKTFLKKILLNVSEAEKQQILSALYKHETELVDVEMPSVIRQLQEKGIKTLGLTNCRTGLLGSIPSMEKWRIGVLEKENIHFSHSFPDLKPCIFKEGDNEARTYREGIVFTARQEKGPALKLFLRYARFFPKKIIFVDNKYKNLESVESFCKKSNINFIGIYYTGALKNPKPPVNQERAKVQFAILKRNHRWLSDPEADRLLKHKGNLCKH